LKCECKLQEDAGEGGEVAESIREDIEQRTGNPVVSPTNFLHLTTGKKRARHLKGNEQEKLLDTDDE